MGSDAMLIHLVTPVLRRLGEGGRRTAPVVVLALSMILLGSTRASAQFDFTGSWGPIGTEDVQNDSLPVDYLGLALTDEGRTRARIIPIGTMRTG